MSSSPPSECKLIRPAIPCDGKQGFSCLEGISKAGVPHLPVNRSKTEPCGAMIARTDPNEPESVVLLPELETFADREVYSHRFSGPQTVPSSKTIL